MFKRLMLDNRREMKPIDLDSPDTDPALKEAMMKRMEEKYPDWTPPEQEHVEIAKRLNLEPRLNEDTQFLLNFNPLYAGTAAFNLALEPEEAGVGLANHHMSIFVTAHLYNALRQQKLIDIRWPTLDRIIALQKGPMFAD